MNINELSDSAKAALLLIASRDGGGSAPVRSSELEQSGMDELCASGCVTINVGHHVYFALSPTGGDAVDAIRRARAS